MSDCPDCEEYSAQQAVDCGVVKLGPRLPAGQPSVGKLAAGFELSRLEDGRPGVIRRCEAHGGRPRSPITEELPS